MRVLGIVTARGGSKGFPAKNLATIAGRPLAAWAHRALAALRARHPELLVLLSTDSPEIAAAWPEVDRPDVLRPAELARDDTPSFAVVDYELKRLAAAGTACDAVLLLQPTSPLTSVDDLDAAWEPFAGGCPSVIGVSEIPHPVQWSFYRGKDGTLAPVLDFREERRQSFETAFLPVGFYLASTGFLAEHRAFTVPGRTVGVVVSAAAAVDIDHPIDLELARAWLQRTTGERPFTLGSRTVGSGAPCLVIAEAGVNHDGDPARAFELVRAAAGAGADVVKFQTFRASDLVTPAAQKASYQQSQTGAGSQLEMLKRLELPVEQLRRLKDEAERLGLVFLSTPFDEASADTLASIGVPGIKLGSGELTNLPFLVHVARLGLPLIVSTGMSTLDEVEDAAAVVRTSGDPPVAWLHCVSSYPAPANESNLRAMDSLRLTLGGPVGMSDHSLGVEVALAAVARGAQVIEKHLTLDRRSPGPDHAASLEPGEFARLVAQIRLVESALGDGVKQPAACERDTAEVARRSVVTLRDLPAGHVLIPADLGAKRPGTGIPPAQAGKVVGRRLGRDLAADTLLRWGDLF